MKGLWALAISGLATAAVGQPDLTGTVPVFEETFATGLNRYDGRTGLWTTLPRRKRLMTNADQTVFLDQGVLPGVDTPVLHAVTEDGLALRSARVPEDLAVPLAAYMRRTGQGGEAGRVRYLSAMISTAETWSQTYGYIEVEAQIPRGRGRWPAVWMTFAGLGWPPELDIFEAYGAGIAAPTPRDHSFHMAGIFDDTGVDGAPLPVDIVNPHAPEGAQYPLRHDTGERVIHKFRHRVQADALGADIYGRVNTYAALWRPDGIRFYFGPDRDSLQEVYRMPLPADLQAPMYLIANDQFTAEGGWWPADAALDQALDPGNAFVIRRIALRAWVPDQRIDMAGGGRPFTNESSVIRDTPGDDLIAPGGGFDLIHLGGGADEIRLSRGRESKIISGFGPDDRIELEGFPFVDTADALSRLTQVGPDVWLSAGADPGWPQTVILRDLRVAEIRADQITLRWPVALDIWAADAGLSAQALQDDDGDRRLTGPAGGARFSDRRGAVGITGSPGPDVYLIGHPGTQIDDPGGVDTLISWTRTTLPAGVERGIARGPRAVLTAPPDGARLETEARGATLIGGPGDDLFVLGPGASDSVLHVRGGHDRVRGLAQGDRLRIGRAVAGLQIVDHPQGALIRLGPDETLLIEGLTPAAARPLVQR